MKINKLNNIENLNRELPLFQVDEFFTPELYNELNSTYPTEYLIKKIQETGLNSASLNFSNKVDINFLQNFLKKNKSWKNLCDYYFSDDFKLDVKKLIYKNLLPFENRKMSNFDINSTNTTINFTCSKNGFKLDPHTDAKQKIIALIIYFPDNEWKKEWMGGTRFYYPNNLNLAKKFVKQMSFNRLERILPFSLLPLRNTHILKGYEENFAKAFYKYKYINYYKNKLIGFIKTNYTFHSVPMLKCPKNIFRKTLLINLNFK